MVHNPRILTIARAEELAAEVATIEPDAADVPGMLAGVGQHLIRMERIGAAEARTLRQQLRMLGGDALISAASSQSAAGGTTAALIRASLAQLHDLADRLTAASLPVLADEIRALLRADEGTARGVLELGGARFAWGARTYVMGIVNVTPDSFSADGLAQPGADLIAAVLERAERAAQEGADLLDIGGESTRPGARPIGMAEELRRVVPSVAAIAGALALPISVDTYHAEVAAAALDAGAHLINDIWGLRTPDGEWNEPLAALVARRGVPIVLMHNRRAQAVVGALGGHYPTAEYHDLLGEVIAGLRASVAFAESCGIPRERIIVDPGLGFGKTPEQNLTLMRRLREFHSIGLPLLVGASRKSFIGLPLNLPPHERDEGTAATTALVVQAHADIVRVHNVQANLRAARIADAIFRPSH